MTADLRTVYVLWFREVIRMWKEPTRILGVVVQPLIFWLVIGAGFMPSFRLDQNAGVDYMQFFYPGVLAMVILFTAIFSTITLIDDKASGFMQLVLVAPGGRASIVLGKSLGVTTIALIQASLFLLVAPFAGVSVQAVHWPLLFAVVLFGALALALLGFVFAWWTESSAAYHALMSIILIPMWILSGGMFPPSSPWIQTIVWLNPMGWLVAGIRAAFAGGVAPLGTVPFGLDAPMAVSLLVAFCMLLIWIGVWICNRKR